jgi:hypothetical protein
MVVHGSNSYDRRPFGLVETVPATCLRFICHVNGAFLFALARGRMDPNVPECLAVRGWRRPNHPIFCTVIHLHACVGFKHAFWSVFLVQAHRGAFWRTSFSKLEGGKWQEAYLPHLLAD